MGRSRASVVLADPGGGKSSLLRATLAASVDRWLDGQADTAVPVLVSAADLAADRRPLPDVLAASVTAELSAMGLVEALPAEFFRAEPWPGVPWLVLVDGLDELIDPTSRRRVLSTLAAVLGDGLGSPYRFVVATRPLPADELDVLGQEVPRYQLQTFTPEDLLDFATRWFTALALPDPQRAAETFTAALERTPLVDLARTPLIATMLCQLYAATPDRGLPVGRSEVYRRFVDLLHERQHAAGRSGIAAQTRAALERYGDHALARAQHTLDRLQALMNYLAAQRHAGNTQPALDVLAAQPDAARPERLPREIWDQFLSESLRRSGLMTVRAGEVTFLHQTLLEYLAARYTAEDGRASTQAFQKLFSPRWVRWIRVGVWDMWSDLSYVGFLLDAWNGTATDPARALHHLATRGRLTTRLGPTRQARLARLVDCEFIAAQAALGTLLPDHVAGSAADVLAALATSPFLDSRNRLRAAEALLLFRDPRGPDLLSVFASSPLHGRHRYVHWLLSIRRGGTHPDRENWYLIDHNHNLSRIHAALTLAEVGDPRGPDTLAALATSLDNEFGDRHLAALTLAEVGDARGLDALATLATSTDVRFGDRYVAAAALTRFGDRRGQEILDYFDTLDDNQRQLIQRRTERPAPKRRRWQWSRLPR